MRGKFVTFEGCDGVGKSTQLKLIKDYIQKNNIDCVFVREPGGTAISEKIRNVILDKSNTEMSPLTEALLYAAARAQLVKEVILPALNQGKLVISDRYIDSSIAYQGFGRDMGIDLIVSINEGAMKEATPDATIFLDLSPELGFARKGGKDAGDRMEQESNDFHKKVYEGYLTIAKMYPNRVIKIDSNDSIDNISNNIVNALKAKGIF